MRAFQTLRTKNNPDFKIDDFEIFTMILSALEWRKFNGEIFLYTDSCGKKLVEEAGISEVWNATYTTLDRMDQFNLDENIFWAGAKIFALSYNPAPCVLIDLDFIVWQPINFERFDSNIAVIHRESTNLSCYPDKSYFKFNDGFALPENLNWNLQPCNAALVYFGSQRFIENYRNFAFYFMNAAKPDKKQSGWDLLPYMVFIEQRWMAMCAEKCGLKIYSLADIPSLFNKEQKLFTHLWGYKQRLRENHAESEKFCLNCAARIAHDFPQCAENFSKVARLSKYFK